MQPAVSRTLCTTSGRLAGVHRCQQRQQLQRCPPPSRGPPIGRCMAVICAAATLGGGEDPNVAAERRWQNQVSDGRVKSVSAASAGDLVSDGWTLLDVRPPHEVQKARLKGAVEVPIFVTEESNDPVSLLKKLSAWSMGGFWLGGTHMKPNTSFVRDVSAAIPKDARVVLACQKGLRSLAAAEQLHRAGYSTIAWINGGLDTARKGDLPSVGDVDLRYGGIGGLTEVVGLTDVQREENPDDQKFNILIKVAVAVLVLDFAAFAYEYINALTQGAIPPAAPR